MVHPFKKDDSQDSKSEQGGSIRLIDSVDIFRGQREVSIIHGECKYRLQITKAGKLILTK